MLGILLFILCLSLGALLVRLLPLRFYRLEYWAASVTVGLLAGSWLVLLVCMLIPYAVGIPLSMLIMLLAIWWLWERKHKPDYVELSRSGWLWWPVCMALSLFFFHLFLTHMLQPTADGWNSMGPTWGDLALHLSLISSFGAQSKFEFSMPILIDTKLTYPFLIDFLSGVLYRGGLSLRWALILPGFALSLSLLQLFFFLSYRLFNRVRAAIMGLLLFLFSASFGGIFLFWKDYQASSKGLLTFIQDLPQDHYAYLPNQGLHVYNVITGFILPQRSFMFGLPLFCLLAILWFEAHKTKDAPAEKKLLLASGVITGLLPFAHVHTFLVAALVFGWLTALDMVRKGRLVTAWSQSMVLAIVIALPQLAWQFLSNYHSGFSYSYLGWELVKGGSLVSFWWDNIGPAGIFLFLTPVLIPLYFKKWKFYQAFFIPFLIVFVAANLYIFQPNPYDNSKLFIYVWLGNSLFMGYFLARWSDLAKGAGIVAIAPLMALMMATGILSFVPELSRSYVFLSNSDIAFASDFKSLVPADARILTADRHNHPVSTITGRPIVMGYRGWLWTYGYDYVPIEKDVRAMYAGGPDTEALLQKYDVSYVVIGNTELTEWGANLEYFTQHYGTIYSEGEWTVFKIK